MRLLVFSDSHGSTSKMTDAILLHPEADMIVHLGDGERDVERIKDIIGSKPLVQVCGNCDFYSLLPVNEYIFAGGVKILCTHGHSELVKHGTQMLYSKAKSAGARIALYGHTHCAVTDYDDGFYAMNPGSIRDGSYGVVDITEGGIICISMKL